MKIIYNSKIFKLPWMNNFSAMVIGRFMFTKYSIEDLPDSVRCHEEVHQRQMNRDGILMFYLKYTFHFLENYAAGMSAMNAYLNIPYEEEAYRLTREASQINRKGII